MASRMVSLTVYSPAPGKQYLTSLPFRDLSHPQNPSSILLVTAISQLLSFIIKGKTVIIFLNCITMRKLGLKNVKAEYIISFHPVGRKISLFKCGVGYQCKIIGN